MLNETNARRSFLGRILGGAAAAGLALTGKSEAAQAKAPAKAMAGGPDAWLNEVKGTHRCLFDFPQHANGMPLLHILNYLNTYKEAYKAAPGSAGAVGTFYSLGQRSSISLAFNDATWAKYGLGEYLGLKDGDGKFYTRNVFNRMTDKDAGIVMAAIGSPDEGLAVRERARRVVPRTAGARRGEGRYDPGRSHREPFAGRRDRAGDGHRD